MHFVTSIENLVGVFYYQLVEKDRNSIKSTCHKINKIEFITLKYFNVGTGTKDPYGKTLRKFLAKAKVFSATTKLSIGPGCDLVILLEIFHHLNYITRLDLSNVKTSTLLDTLKGRFTLRQRLLAVEYLASGKNMDQIILPADFPIWKIDIRYLSNLSRIKDDWYGNDSPARDD